MQHFYQNIHGWFNFENLYWNFIQNLPNKSKIVEVGVWKGKSISYLIVEMLNSGKEMEVYAVDTWEGSPEHFDDTDVINKTLYEAFLSNIEPIKNNINIIRKPSIEAASFFEDNSVDAVFIDANHSYENVKEDLLAWYPKIKQNGYMSGHDFDWPGVNKAVKEVLGEQNAVSFPPTSWMFRKT